MENFKYLHNFEIEANGRCPSLMKMNNKSLIWSVINNNFLCVDKYVLRLYLCFQNFFDILLY